MNATHLVLLSAALPATALAQPFSIEWHTIDSGGATTLDSGAYTLAGSIGQPDAGTLAAAPFECQGGFWNTGQPSPPACYANCDGSTASPILSANDFTCFLNAFVTSQSYADCDGFGGLTANDFQCFLNRFVQGCT